MAEETIQESEATKHQNSLHGKTNTIKIEPIPRGFTEAYVHTFVKSILNTEIISITLNNASHRMKISRDANIRDARTAFVVLKSAEAANYCQKHSFKRLFGGYTCEISLTPQSAKRSGINLKNKTEWIKITNIAKKVNEEMIIKHIKKHTQIGIESKSVILFHHHTKEKYDGFAFVHLNSTEHATECVEKLRMKKLKGNEMWVAYKEAPKILERNIESQSKIVILCNLHWTVKEEDIRELCNGYGEIEKVSVWNDKSGYPQGRACVVMKNEEDGMRVFDGLNGKEIKGFEIMTVYKKKIAESLKQKLIKDKSIKKKEKKKKKPSKASRKRMRAFQNKKVMQKKKMKANETSVKKA